MNYVFILFNANDDLPQVGYRHIHWAHQGTSAGRKFLGTTDDLFVRNDVPLVEETGDPLVENRAVHDELTEDETEEQVWLQRNEFLTECKSGRIVNKLTRNTRQKHSTG